MNNNFFANIYSFLVLSHLTFSIDKRPNFFYSTFFTKEAPNVSFEEIHLRISEIYFKDLMIFSLNDKQEDDFKEFKQIKGYGDSTLTIFYVKPTVFFSTKFLVKLATHLKNCPGCNIALIYEGISLNTIKLAFKINGIQISGGNNTLKHILSPQQFLLSKIITIFYGNNIDLVSKSFLEISKNKSLSRAIHDFTSEKDRLLLKEILSQNKEYEQSTEDKKIVNTCSNSFIDDDRTISTNNHITVDNNDTKVDNTKYSVSYYNVDEYSKSIVKPNLNNFLAPSVSTNKRIKYIDKSYVFRNKRRSFSTEREDRKIPIWKYKVNSIYMDVNEFNLNNFTKSLTKVLTLNNTYSLLVKVQYTNIEGHILYCMLDEQMGIFYDSKYTIETKIADRFSNLEDKLEYYMSQYNAVEINLIQIMYVVNNSFDSLRLKNINKELLDKNIINVKETKKVFSNSILPLSTNEIYYGKPLSFEVNSTKNSVSSLYIGEIEFISRVKLQNEQDKKTNIEFESNTRFYLYNINNKEYVITVRDLDDNKTIKEVYNISGYKVVGNVIDVKLDNNIFTRKIHNVLIEFEGDTVNKKNIHIKLPVFKLKSTRYTGMANPNIGTFDMETYKDFNSNSKVYALGFATLEMLKEKKSSLYYLKRDGETSNDIIVKCIDEMLSVKNRDHIYYTHNLGGYDIVFLLKALKEANKQKGFEYYKISSNLRDSKVLKCIVKIKTPSGYNKITFVDSYNLLTDSLDALSKSFGSEIKKGLFPYNFVKSNTLNYKGNTPSRDFYIVKNKKINSIDYKKIYKKDWCLKSETLKYLEQDLLSLLEIVDTFNKYVYIEYGVQMTESMTISRLALNIYIKKYLKDTLLPVINNISVFSSIKKAYYGGVVEVYKPTGKNLRYYDVNSLYPFVAKNTMPGHLCEYIESKKTLDINELFGFFYCKVKTNNGYLGLLPVHQKGLIMPNGEWYGWYFSEELKFAKDNGYEIDVFKGYKFNKVNSVFDDYVDDLYKTKATSTGSVKLITKLLLNSLLGRFGMSIFKLQTDIVPMDKYLEILSSKSINSSKAISDTDMLISFSNVISKKITSEHGLDYIEILNHNSGVDLEKTNSFEDVAVSISAAVTAYARIYMGNIKLDIIKRGGEIYYTDTDSIVTNIELPKHLVGNELGQFKLEYIVKEAYFISAKTYCLVLAKDYVTNKNKGLIIKSKGVFDNSLTLAKFKSMYYDKKNIKAIKSNTETNYLEGYVDIGTKKVTLSYDAYTKRAKVYSLENLWIDTKALVYSEDCKPTEKLKK